MAATGISLDEAVELTRTGDLWLFRGRAAADRAIRVTTNSPVNHVGMALVLEDLPPMMWHAELGRSLPDLWAGTHQRGVQLHDLRAAVTVWGTRYGQQAWLRQLEPPVGTAAEDAALRTVARLDGTPFPSTVALAGRWLRGRVPATPARLPGTRRRGRPARRGWSAPRVWPAPRGWPRRRTARSGTLDTGPGRPGEPAPPAPPQSTDRSLETAYCAEVVALTYQAMGLLPAGRRASWYDPGRFWSGDDLHLAGGARLGGEIAVRIPRG